VLQEESAFFTTPCAQAGRWAEVKGLQPRETVYVAWTPGRRRLRFTKTGDENLERAYRTHWVDPGLIAAKQRRQVE
jgi:hypothetical protein